MLPSMLQQTRYGFSACIAFAAVLLVAAPQASASPIELLDGRCEITAPEGWRVDATYAGAGVVLQPPDPRAWPVEVAAWVAPDGAEHSAGAAAASHEAVLRRQYAYARDGAEALTGPNSLQGLLVTGRVATDAGQEVASVFAAFCRAGRYYVVGTFAFPGRAQMTVERYLRPVLGGMEIRHSPLQKSRTDDESTGAAPDDDTHPAQQHRPETPEPSEAETPEPAEAETADRRESETPGQPEPPVADQPDSQPADLPAGQPAEESAQQPPEETERDTPQQAGPEQTPDQSIAIGRAEPPVGPQYDTEPATIPGRSVTEAPLFERTAGALSIRAPADWIIEPDRGRWTVHPQGMEQKALGVLVWPLAVSGSTPGPAEVAREALKHWSPTAGYDLQIRRDGPSRAIVSGTGLGVGGPLRILGSCEVSGDRALLSAIYVTSRRSVREWPTLARMLASVKIEGLQFTEPHYAVPAYNWTLPGAPEVTLQVPEGWRIRGKLDNSSQLDALTIETVDPGSDRMYVTVHQPIVPLFKGLSQLLVGLGYDAGDRYHSEGTGFDYTLLSRMSPEEFVLEYWNKQSRISLQEPEIVASEKTREARRLLTSADASGRHLIVEGESRLGRRRHHYLVATGGINTGDASTWQAAVIEAGGPKEKESQVLAAARTLLHSADIEPTGSAPQIAAANLLRRAAGAVGDFPQLPQAPMKGIYAPLAHAQADTGRFWKPPGTSTAVWEKLVTSFIEGGDPAESVPEIKFMQTSPEEVPGQF